VNPEKLGLVKCEGCGSFIDPTTCGCGYPIDHPYMDGHSGIPQGCSCRRDPGIRWNPGDLALSPGDPAPRPVVVLEVLANDWVKVQYAEGDTLQWKRWELKQRT
jgi:hypothetical protein